jgi:DNA-binding transcriptional regulator YdaS (Cro superfamily)
MFRDLQALVLRALVGGFKRMADRHLERPSTDNHHCTIGLACANAAEKMAAIERASQQVKPDNIAMVGMCGTA